MPTSKAIIICDFETNNSVSECRVWAWGALDLVFDDFYHGNSIETFFDYAKELLNTRLYFHNLKFDGAFIVNYLLSHNYTHTKSRKLFENEFSTLISDMGQWYSIRVNFGGHILEIYDSLKLIPMPVANIPKAFGFETVEEKGEIDYNLIRPEDYCPTPEEIEYIYHDCSIVARDLKFYIDMDLKRMTIGSNALNFYKGIVGGDEKFKKKFPPPEYDKDIRQAYKGGFTYLNPKFANKMITRGCVLDVNSMYPWAMKYMQLPFGEGLRFEGRYCTDENYPLYIQCFECAFDIKPNKIPTVQLKNYLGFNDTEYLTSSNGDNVILFMTNIDYDMFVDHYNIYNVSYKYGYKFRGMSGLFSDYIDYWTDIKIKAKTDNNRGMYTLSKTFLNSLYGKFATNPRTACKIPYLSEGVLKFKTLEEPDKPPVYLPVGIFITSWSRHRIITAAQELYPHFMYADTDSLHLDILPDEIPETIEIHDTKLGAFKCEFIIEKAKYLHQKCYVEYGHEPDSEKRETKTVVAGLPKKLHSQVTLTNFRRGVIYRGKLVPKQVKNGVILNETTFEIK